MAKGGYCPCYDLLISQWDNVVIQPNTYRSDQLVKEEDIVSIPTLTYIPIHVINNLPIEVMVAGMEVLPETDDYTGYLGSQFEISVARSENPITIRIELDGAIFTYTGNTVTTAEISRHDSIFTYADIDADEVTVTFDLI